MKKILIISTLLTLASVVYFSVGINKSDNVQSNEYESSFQYRILPKLFVGIIQSNGEKVELKTLSDKEKYDELIEKERQRVLTEFLTGYKNAKFEKNELTVFAHFYPIGWQPYKFKKEVVFDESDVWETYPKEFLNIYRELEEIISSYNSENAQHSLTLKIVPKQYTTQDPRVWLERGDIILNFIRLEDFNNSSAGVANSVTDPEFYVPIRRYEMKSRPGNVYSILEKKYGRVLVKNHVCEYKPPLPQPSEIHKCFQTFLQE